MNFCRSKNPVNRKINRSFYSHVGDAMLVTSAVGTAFCTVGGHTHFNLLSIEFVSDFRAFST